MIYFTADLHFGHANIIHHCNRPFRNSHEMDEALIENWNRTVTQDIDQVYMLGDIGWRSRTETERILCRLRGHKFILWGNHDRNSKRPRRGFTDLGHYYELQTFTPRHPKQLIVLCHYPLESWRNMARGTWMLFGHCHGNLRRVMRNRLDVGVDCWNYRPVSLLEVEDALPQSGSAPSDYHDAPIPRPHH